MADFFAPKPRAGRVAPEPNLGSIPEDAPDETLPRERSDDQLDSKEHVAEAVDAYVAAKSFRPALARAVASAARNVPELRDDVYDHVLTALRRQPKRGWPLLCVVALTCPPATDGCRRKVDAALACASSDYARYALFVHEVLGAVASPPSEENVAAFAIRPPSVLSVTLVDGESLVEALPVAPWVDCAAVARHLVGTRLRLTDARRSTFGLFFADNGRPLHRSEFVGDVHESAFVFKRILRFLHEPSRSDDVLFERLNFLQCEDDVLNEGRLPIPRKDAGALAALSLLATMGAATPIRVEDLAALTEDLSIGECYPPSYEGEEPLTLASLAAPHVAEFRKLDARALHRAFVDRCRARPLYGAHVFEVDVVGGLDAPGAYRLAVGSRGLALLDDDDVFGVDCRYAVGDVASWSSTGDSVEVRFREAAPLLVESAQALGIVAALDVCIKRLGVVVEEPSQRRDWTAHGLFAAAEEGAEESKGD